MPEIAVKNKAEIDWSQYKRKTERGSQYGDVLKKLEPTQVATFNGLTRGQVSYLRQLVNGLGGENPRPAIRNDLEMAVKDGKEKDAFDVAVRIKAAKKAEK